MNQTTAEQIRMAVEEAMDTIVAYQDIVTANKPTEQQLLAISVLEAIGDRAEDVAALINQPK